MKWAGMFNLGMSRYDIDERHLYATTRNYGSVPFSQASKDHSKRKKQFVSKAHSMDILGVDSPGPRYNPTMSQVLHRSGSALLDGR